MFRHTNLRHKNVSECEGLDKRILPQNETNLPQNETKLPQNETNESHHVCDKCNRGFKRTYHLQRHMSRCKGIAHNLECPTCHQMFGYREALYRHKKIGGCVAIKEEEKGNNCIVTNNNITHNNNCVTTTTNNIHNNIHNNINIQLNINSFGHENVEYITTELAKKCLEMGWHGLLPMIDSIFFNPEHPENFNVKLTSLKNSLVDVKVNNTWKPRGLNDTIDKMIDKSGTQIICKAEPQHLSHPEIVSNMNSIRNIEPNAKRKLRERTKARLVERRIEEEENGCIVDKN